MQYILVFALVLGGYTVLDWGYQRVNHRKVSMLSLIMPKTAAKQTASTTPTAPVYNA